MIKFKRIRPEIYKNKVQGMVHKNGVFKGWADTGEVSIVHKYSALKPQEWYMRDGVIYLSCPDCGKATRIVDHEITDKGIVTPSVVSQTKNCSFHDFIQLLDYDISPNNP